MTLPTEEHANINLSKWPDSAYIELIRTVSTADKFGKPPQAG